MKNYIVGYLSFFENELKLIKISEESEYKAVRQCVLGLCSDEESRQQELEWQNSDDYPQDFESLDDMLYNSDIAINVIEI